MSAEPLTSSRTLVDRSHERATEKAPTNMGIYYCLGEERESKKRWETGRKREEENMHAQRAPTAIAIPNNPLNIYHIPESTIHYRPLNKNKKVHANSLLQPLDTWVSSYNSVWNHLALDNIVPITDFIFSQVVTAYKGVTLGALAHKQTGIEKKLNEQALKLNTQKGLNKKISHHTPIPPE